WISQTLGEREHLALSLDRAGENALSQALSVALQLWVAGVPVQIRKLVERLRQPEVHSTPPSLTFRAHFPPVVAAAKLKATQKMDAAPWLPPVLAVAAVAQVSQASSVESPWHALVRKHSEVHQNWLRQQTEVHGRFLEFRQRALRALVAPAATPPLVRST